MSTLSKEKRNTWSIVKEKHYLLLCEEKAITDLLDKCVTSAGLLTLNNHNLYFNYSNCYLRIINLHFKSKFKYTEDLDKTCSYKWSSSRLI